MTTASSRVVVLNGWAASPHAWDLCTFQRDAVFSYIDQLEGLPEKMILESSADERFTFVGWSMGGSSALRLACQFPNRVARLVLVAATARMMEDKAAGWRGLSPRRLEALHQSIRITHGEGFFGIPPGKPNPFMLDSEENLSRGIRYLLDTDLRADLERTFGSPESAANQQTNKPTNQLTTFPVHLFHSERDGVVRPENAHYLKRVFPHASLTFVPGTEHALPIFIPELIDAAVLDSKPLN